MWYIVYVEIIPENVSEKYHIGTRSSVENLCSIFYRV